MKKTIYPSLTRAFLCLAVTMQSLAFTFAQNCDNQILFASSNTSGNVGVFDVLDNSNITSNTFPGTGEDADGIFYNFATDELYQVNRTDNVVDEYNNVLAALNGGMNPTISTSSSSDFSNGRELAAFDDKLVVAQDANAGNGDQNRLIVYTVGNGAITLDKIFDVNINLWGTHLDGNTLYAIQDNSSNVAVYQNFFDNAAGSLIADMIISVENLVRTHGLTYDAASDLMILTDIGEASSATDGALIVISNFTTKAADGMISMSEQVRVSGGTSLLGNPVDVAYNSSDNRIYVAERAREGGLILGFKVPVLSGGIAPFYQAPFAGASAVHFSCSDGADLCEAIDGGTVEFTDGGTEVTIFIDGSPDMLTFESDVPTSTVYDFTYVVTDADGMILGIPPGNMVNFDDAGLGVCIVYGLSYTGNLNIAQGDDLFAMGLQISDDCFDLSDNSLIVNRVMPQSAEVQVFASSNTSGTVGVVEVLPDGNTLMKMFDSQEADADGIFYNDQTDMLYQLNRTNNVVDVYSGVAAALANGTAPTYETSSTSDFANGREIAVSGDKLIVAQDASAANNMTNSLMIYTLGMNSITFEKTYNVNFNLWGIHLDGSTLYAIQDNSDNLAIFENIFDNPAGIVEPDQVIFIQDMVRTHGLTYDAASDLMILTDIGEASSATDGFLVVVQNFSTKIGDNILENFEQVRIGGGTSLLGNPVDVAFDATNETIYVAERAREGGLILGFKPPALSGGAAPFFKKSFAGASAVNITGSQGAPCVLVDAGSVALENGGTEATIFIDGNPDVISFASDVTPVDYQFTYVVTDADGIILGIPPGNSVDFDDAGVGVCNVYGLAYTGNLNIMMGDDLLEMGLEISDDCFNLSSNNLSIDRILPQTPIAQVFASSNTSGQIGVLGVLDPFSAVMGMFSAQGEDADGIYYDHQTDMLYQLSISSNVIDVYNNVNANLANGGVPTYMTSSTSDFSNGREITVVGGDKLVVAQDANAGNGNQNRLIVYDISGGGITLMASYDVNINLWGIEGVNDDLFAIVDNSNQLAIFEDIASNANNTTVAADQIITVENLVRTHGLAYSNSLDYLVLTDIGSAASAFDGALITIENFTSAAADDMIGTDEQVRVSGGTSQLGNPVDVAYDKGSGLIYVAERARDGGKILAFRTPRLSGGIAPVYEKFFAGASAVYLQSDANINDFDDNEVELDAFTQVNNTPTVTTEIFPNPATTQLNVVMESDVDINATINIFNINGALLKSRRVDLFQGQNRFEISLDDVESGVLFFTIPELGKAERFLKVNE
ncbi:MAG: T9SS type A sorting domain-containing protein [Bacteroidota bacterium]